MMLMLLQYKCKSASLTPRVLHLPPTPQPESMRHTKVASSLDTMSTLSTTTLESIRVIRLYREPSIRASATGTNDEPANK